MKPTEIKSFLKTAHLLEAAAYHLERENQYLSDELKQQAKQLKEEIL